jgi:hypothetical protein
MIAPRELLTATRQATLLSCPRRHYWRFEVGLVRDTEAAALRFGSAWHAAMEARWKGGDYETALAAALATASDFDETTVATLAGLLAGYYARWENDPVREIHPEVEFRHALPGSRTFDVAGKIDGLGVLHDGRLCMVEHKTTSASVGPDSDYWLRIRFNPQVLQYVHAARGAGWDIETVLYDVVRKPAISPLAAVPVLDEHGRKIVLDATGERVFKRDGEPRESGDTAKGYALQTRPESPEEFADRLAADCRERPDFYFARREVPVLDADLDEFAIQRREIARMILNFRAASRRAARPDQAWPRNLSELQCRTCDYASFCLQNIFPDPATPPAGFRVGGQTPELSDAVG